MHPLAMMMLSTAPLMMTTHDAQVSGRNIQLNAATAAFSRFDDAAAMTAPLDDMSAEDVLPFGTAGTWRWSIGGGGAIDLRNSRNRLVQSGVGLSYFIADGLSFETELNAIYFNQVGDDAVGLNWNLAFRHHLILDDTWSLFVEAGAGMLGATERVPYNGSRFNFIPHAGGGLSFDVGNNVRLLTGVRWHHISNANTHRDNPGRDSVMGYVSLSFPF